MEETLDSPAQSFMLDAWIDRREADPNYTMVEIGHGSHPAAVNQSFKGKRAYIGIESWLSKNEASDDRRDSYDVDENVFFLATQYDKRADHHETASVLPDGLANEVFMGNVLGDPLVFQSPGRMQAILAEAKRVLQPGGKIIIRESRTPYDFIVNPQVAEAGLTVDARITPQQSVDWTKLEQLHEPHYGNVYDTQEKESFYLVLST